MTVRIDVYPNRARLLDAAADRFVHEATRAAADRGRFTVALSGGTTPVGLFARLAAAPRRDRVPWDRTHVLWSDERDVPPTSPDSNYRVARETLLDHVPLAPAQVHRFQVEKGPRQAAAEYGELLSSLVGDDGIDLLLLGMGADGHVASVFPGTAAAYESGRGAVAALVPQLGGWRVSLTMGEMCAARRVLVLVASPEKAPALADLRTGQSGSPASRISAREGVEWLTDRPTAEAVRRRHDVVQPHAAATAAESAKRRAGETAAAWIESGMRVGLGTGSTARYVVEALGRRLAEGHVTDVVAAATSTTTEALAAAAGVPLRDVGELGGLDLAVDGADEISPDLDLIKGLGGALVREKIVAAASRRFVVVADAAKLVDRLGTRAPVPVAVLPFGWRSVADRLASQGLAPAVREHDGRPYVSDDGLLILDCAPASGIADPAELARRLSDTPGVVDHGLFLGMADSAIVADSHGIMVYHR